jgi:heme exporter protein CcmD
MSGLAEYLAMGGYAGFVWPAYGFALGALGGLALHSWRRYRASVTALGRGVGNAGPAR